MNELTREKTKLRGNGLFKLLDIIIGIPALSLVGLISVKQKELPKQVNVLMVIKLSAMGDTILLIPAMRALRKRFPEARIVAVCTKINSDIFSACPYVDDVLLIDMKNLINYPLGVIKELRKRRADIALDFDQWLRISSVLAFASGASCRYGFKTVGQYRHYAYTDYVEHGKGVHEIDNFLAVLKFLSIEKVDRTLEFTVSNEAQTKAEQVLDGLGLRKGSRFIVFHPETPAHGGQRQWPADNYIELGKRLIAQANVEIIVSGTAKDRESNKRIVSEIGKGAVALPPVSLQEYAAVLDGAAVMVCGNTGVMHLACALKVPVVALHGPTDPAQWGPAGTNSIVIKSRLNCSPCLYLGYEYGCGTNRCMRDIPVDAVLEAVEGLIAKSL